MKKLAITLGTVAIIGASTIPLITPASAEELPVAQQDVNKQNSQPPYALESSSNSSVEGSTAINEYGQAEGINDPSSVNLTIKKINPNEFTTYAAGWQPIGSDTFKTTSKTFYSGGGNIKLKITQPYLGRGYTWSYRLVEEDGWRQQVIKDFTLDNVGGTYEITAYTGSYVDGNNKKAEIILKKTTNPLTSVSVKVED
ncbi:hypothetical protein ABEP18_21250 [Priestia megaterium]